MDNSAPSDVPGAQSRILILGATGGTGRLIVRQALARGHDVTALVRSPEKGRGLEGARIIVGDARDGAALRGAVAGQAAIISALGTPASPFGEVTILPTATRALVSAIKARQVARLVCVEGVGAATPLSCSLLVLQLFWLVYAA